MSKALEHARQYHRRIPFSELLDIQVIGLRDGVPPDRPGTRERKNLGSRLAKTARRSVPAARQLMDSSRLRRTSVY